MEQWGCLCSVHDITLFLLRCHVNTMDKQREFNNDCETQRFAYSISSLQRQIKEKVVCVTNFTHVLLENQVYAIMYFCQYVELEDKKISVTTFINSFLAAFDSTAQDLAARFNKK